ncbi:HDOD domain-containing protein [Motiliproteus sp. SC1-56]|uniref:HDOD domain-containing protein n=1 Tax=Motiliproteus sp. SC1-56 TaxID=2799565 RepID=UPI001A8D17CD
MPHALLRLIDCCQQRDVSFDTLATLIRQDAALAARVINAAHASSLAQWNHLHDLDRILVVLGLDTIKHIAFTAAVQEFFAQFNQGASALRRRLWRASLSCACSARTLARLSAYPSPEEAYLAGLLHNLGQMAYLQGSPDAYAELLHTPLADAELDARERERFGLSSTQWGAEQAERWAPDSFIGDAIRYQRRAAHALGDAPHLVRLINLARKMSTAPAEDDQLLAAADQLLGLNQDLILQLHEDSATEVNEIARTFGIPLGADHRAAGESEARQALGVRVQGLALTRTVQITSPPGAALWSELLGNLNILFDLPDALAFEFQPRDGKLACIARTASVSPAADALAIHLDGSPSLITQGFETPDNVCLEQASADDAPVVDGQLKRLLSASHLLCLGLQAGSRPLGALVAGLTADNHRRLQSQKPLLKAFTQALVEQLEARESRQQQRAEEQAQWLARNRRLVHEAANPLGAIQNYLQVLSLKLGTDPAVDEQLRFIREEMERVGSILVRMKEPVDVDSGEASLTDVNTLIERLVSLYRASLFASRGIGATLDLAPDLAQVSTDTGALKQILTNLLKNAAEALTDGGEVEVASRHLNVDGHPHIELHVRDNGPGLPPEILSRAFTPVQSTKGKEHSGLGLAIVASLVTRLQGSISCTNQKTGGAEFVIRLPCTLKSQ